MSTVYVPEGSFGVLDHGEIPAHTADWSNGLVAVMTTGALIATGIHTGPVRVQAISTAALPPSPDEEDPSWEEIIEVTVQAPHAELRVESLHDGVIGDLPLLSTQGPGPYRLRVHVRGREVARDKVCHEPTEDYLLLVWPAGTATGTVILRSSEEIQEALQTRVSPPLPADDTLSAGERRDRIERDRLLRGGADPAPPPSA
ncbi:hypothetical protein [Streptomyces spectabilis]|uniref:Uncharacterized protein n=1 Tax=Streptomyces spectabilis TaxID=68270 RepID=A0A7W8B4P8_STRST|nr:hypothetical protein [Streptomyces spectabilis]MBB5109160.1 hypothetical protein [Streptomyces spectabilis]MCI3907721.1 hypothetical protein [Streptomyces spectabilis]GGV51148.1 hypothetical protein GCM10010245_80510 [Streptomyces spectabilis]